MEYRNPALNWRRRSQTGMRIHRRGAEIAELIPRRRRGGMGWETLARILHAEARLVGQAIALRGLSRFAVLRPADRRQKAIVCPTGHGAESMSCGLVSAENTLGDGERRRERSVRFDAETSTEEQDGRREDWQ